MLGFSGSSCIAVSAFLHPHLDGMCGLRISFLITTSFGVDLLRKLILASQLSALQCLSASVHYRFLDPETWFPALPFTLMQMTLHLPQSLSWSIMIQNEADHLFQN